MDAERLSSVLQQALPDCELQVEGEGANYQIRAVGACFEGLNRVKRQQLVYAALTDLIRSGEVHAVTIQAQTAAEAGA